MSPTTYFPQRLWQLANSDPTGSISFNPTGDGIYINPIEFGRHYLNSGWLKTSRYSSFVRQLNIYGFRQQNVVEANGRLKLYKNPNFIRDRPDLLANIRRATLTTGRTRTIKQPKQPNSNENISPGQVMQQSMAERDFWHPDIYSLPVFNGASQQPMDSGNFGFNPVSPPPPRPFEPHWFGRLPLADRPENLVDISTCSKFRMPSELETKPDVNLPSTSSFNQVRFMEMKASTAAAETYEQQDDVIRLWNNFFPGGPVGSSCRSA